VDVLKIDKSFIDPLAGKDEESRALVTAILGLADTLGLEVIAEGIEHQSQLHHLVELGCHRGQGFLMARPLDTEAAVHYIAESSRDAVVG
jgi:EAL domain-containing protein (putative c-di-GMP-specific phosphodiesterase class I)